MVKKAKTERGKVGSKEITMTFKGKNKAEVIEEAEKYMKITSGFYKKTQGFLENKFYIMVLECKEKK